MTDETPRKETTCSFLSLDGEGAGFESGRDNSVILNPPPTPSLREGENMGKEINGFEALGLLEPTRYGDWDVKGRCSDF